MFLPLQQDPDCILAVGPEPRDHQSLPEPHLKRNTVKKTMPGQHLQDQVWTLPSILL